MLSEERHLLPRLTPEFNPRIHIVGGDEIASDLSRCPTARIYAHPDVGII